MPVVCKYPELSAKGLSAESRLRQHAINRFLDYPFRMFFEDRSKGCESFMPHVPGVMKIHFLFRLPAGDLDLRGVDDDDVIAGIHVGSVHRLMLAPDYPGDLSRKATEHHATRIDDVPLMLDIPRGGGVSLHITGLIVRRACSLLDMMENAGNTGEVDFCTASKPTNGRMLSQRE